VSASNVVLAHLLYERRLITLEKPSKLPDIGGRFFNVTDPNPAIRFQDLYLTLEQNADSKPKFTLVPPLPFFLMSYLIEVYDRAVYFFTILPELPQPLCMLTPALFGASNVHAVIDDSVARKAPEEGGLGYRAPMTTADGLCTQVLEFNRTLKETGKDALDDEAKTPKAKIERAAIPAPKKI
jgi:hypothetical protein